MENLPNWLKNRRLKSRLDVRALSLKSFVTTAQISRIEHEKSDLTINALVMLGHGLGFNLEDVFAVLGLSFPSLKHEYSAAENSELFTFPKIEDSIAMWHLIDNDPQKARQLLFQWYMPIEARLSQSNIQRIEDKFSIAWEALQSRSGHYSLLAIRPAPKFNNYFEILHQDGIISTDDLGFILAERRREIGGSQRDLADAVNISNSVISRLESGSIERVSFDYMLALDKALEMNGKLIAFAWSAGEYQSGVAFIRKADAKNISVQLENYVAWGNKIKWWSDCFLSICRWQDAFQLTPTWIDYLRKEVDHTK